MKIAGCVAATFAAFGAAPCLWDADTLDDELRGLPAAFDLVVGRWHRHGDAYYEDRVRRLLAQPALSLADHDDLAVAHEHLGQRDRAIEVMQRKAVALAASPDREQQYRYHANLGTFLAHDGRYDEALVELRRAIEIEPNAHFGREHFQIELIEYAAAAKTEPGLWRRGSFLLHAGHRLSFSPFLFWLRELSADEEEEAWTLGTPLDYDRGLEAIGGMLRFGGREGPELYRALAELFLAEQHLNLAWWALQHAIERGHPAAETLRRGVAGIERHWREATTHVESRLRAPSMAVYREHREAADRWVAAFQRLEAKAIARGEDVHGDAGLRRLLAAADSEVPRPGLPWGFTQREWILGSLALAILVCFVAKECRRRRAAAA